MHAYSSKRRSKSSEMFYKLGVLKDFAKFTVSQGNTCAGVSLNKIPAWEPTLLKQRPRNRCFSNFLTEFLQIF